MLDLNPGFSFLETILMKIQHVNQILTDFREVSFRKKSVTMQVSWFEIYTLIEKFS